MVQLELRVNPEPHSTYARARQVIANPHNSSFANFFSPFPNALTTIKPLEVPPCISAALNQNLTGENGRLIRIAFADEYLKSGRSPEEIVTLFESQSGYSFEKSIYYVQDLASRGYGPFRCVAIREVGFCLETYPRKQRITEPP
jgi:DNA primase large subunit